MKRHYLLNLLIILLLLNSCANSVHIETQVEPYGFFSGIWHGLILPFSFFGSWFFDGINIYASNNNGFWYDFGFLLSAGFFSYHLHSAIKEYNNGEG